MMDLAADLVESALLKKIDEGNIIAIIFYCKTKLKHRGYTERVERVQVDPPKLNVNFNDGAIIERAIQRRIYADARINRTPPQAAGY
ncbi:MAG: hypothetical protein JSS50_01790 [Proteobacteria bacterium]|nr:hypothetical protein [Pseudomonadota bacterium]